MQEAVPSRGASALCDVRTTTRLPDGAFLRAHPHHEATPGSSGELSAEALLGARHCPGHWSPLHTSIEGPEPAPHIQVSSLVPSPWDLCSKLGGGGTVCLLLRWHSHPASHSSWGTTKSRFPACTASVSSLWGLVRPPTSSGETRGKGEKTEHAAAFVVIGEVMPWVCLQPSLLGCVWVVTSVSTPNHSHFHCQAREGCSLKAASCSQLPRHIPCGRLSLRAHASANTELSFPFVFHPHGREDRTDPRKPLLCEVWVPDARVAQPGSPCVD